METRRGGPPWPVRLAAIAAVLAVAGVLVLGLVGSDLIGDRPSPSPAPDPSPTGSPSAPRAVVAQARVVPVRTSDLAVATPGIVQRILVREQQRVVTGQILLRLAREHLQAAVRRAEASAARAASALHRAQLQLESLGPDVAPAHREAVEADVRLAQTEVAAANAAVEQARLALEQADLRAPFSGIVASIGTEVGEWAAPDVPVITIGDVSEWRIETTNLSEFDVVRVREGDQAMVTFEALPGVSLGGVVIQVRAGAGGATFAAIVRPDEPTPPELRWNMTATVRIDSER